MRSAATRTTSPARRRSVEQELTPSVAAMVFASSLRSRNFPDEVSAMTSSMTLRASVARASSDAAVGKMGLGKVAAQILERQHRHCCRRLGAPAERLALPRDQARNAGDRDARRRDQQGAARYEGGRRLHLRRARRCEQVLARRRGDGANKRGDLCPIGVPAPVGQIDRMILAETEWWRRTVEGHRNELAKIAAFRRFVEYPVGFDRGATSRR